MNLTSLFIRIKIKTLFRKNCSNMSSKRKASDEKRGADEKKKKPPTNNFWALGLLNSMNDPTLQVKTDEKIVIIKDKYPKAKYHYLVLPKEDISNLRKLTTNHIELLTYMEDAANDLISTDEHKSSSFKLGYHAEASMHRLHMHVISDDMNSECMKNKKHWNTFTTEFFLDAKAIRQDLEENGKITLIPSKEEIKNLLNKSLKCHKCDHVPKNIPKLKEHILSHLK